MALNMIDPLSSNSGIFRLSAWHVCKRKWIWVIAEIDMKKRYANQSLPDACKQFVVAIDQISASASASASLLMDCHGEPAVLADSEGRLCKDHLEH